ncbi:MAG: tRNA preQ1(34) S-adenosylmethionine ribosyltransferase-isomerase QueA [Candidatus Omnitrophica bacterium]|nr:tRNA preQ1(34) S-adenosylmethionine ribosyltransferase-isomerase QueA [Candidatus Omnitrophota bacterium]
MKLANFDYNLPKELIAQHPLKERDSAKLMVLNRKDKSIEHCVFKDIVNYFRKEDLIILNDTRVLSCRLEGKRLTGGRVEVLLLNQEKGMTFKAMIKPARLRLNEEIKFNNGSLVGRLTERNRISFSANSVQEVYSHGQVPLPPYIKRIPDESDKDYYQTVYAIKDGAIASPTAGLHFTKELMKDIQGLGVNFASLTLHVGLGTFKPVKTDNIEDHIMESELFNIPDKTIKCLEKAKKNNARVCAVGTTSLRSLETYALGLRDGVTNLYITPGFKFNLADCLLTNFHLPCTTLFMLVCAFAGEDFAKKAYKIAVEKEYRFYSYGDAMLIL